MIQLSHLTNGSANRPRNELEEILPQIASHSRPKLIQQLRAHGMSGNDLQSDCYSLYDQHGIDPLLEIHPLRESFFQMELSQGRHQQPTKPAKQQASMGKNETQIMQPKDFIRISKDSLLIFMAISLLLLLILQVLPKQ